MSKKLVIVESPGKIKKLSQILGSDYIVMSSKGHVRDLSTRGKFGLGVDVDDNFKPDYKFITGKKKVVNELKKESEKVDKTYLATDPDREGEAIAWHLYETLGLNENNYNRVTFNEITKSAVEQGFKNAKKIDKDFVNSQEARRILDRIIGFRLSKFIQNKTDGKSAGRVQSVLLKLIVDREREINAFKPEEYWTITALFKDFKSDLFGYKDKKIEIKTELEATKILNSLSNSFEIEDVSKKLKSKSSKFPFITSTMQQEAFNKLHFSSKKTMQLAQKLYEGVDLASDTVGLITYMRTDSTRLSNDFISEAFKFIETKYGKEYLGRVKVNKKTKNVQDGHEAIRPTSLEYTPESVKPYLTNDEFKLYRIIYYRALASLMADAKIDGTTVILNNNDYKFKATGQVQVFDGYLKVYKDYEDVKDNVLPPFDSYKSKIIVSNEIIKEQHFTKPPARYNEASINKAMEELGIGRPATYAQSITNITSRGYVTVIDKKFVPTDIAMEITDRLQECFSDIISITYTAQMEENLDEIASGKKIWYKVLDNFYKEFEPRLEDALEKIPKKEAKKTGEKCPLCGHDLVIRNGRYGKFVACSNFPSCKYIKQEPREDAVVCDCPKCDGQIVEKRSKRGKTFYGCNNYPKCKTAYWDKPTGEKCPLCGSMLLEKKDKIKCSNCDYVK